MFKQIEICGQRFVLYSPDKGHVVEQSAFDRGLWAKEKESAVGATAEI